MFRKWINTVKNGITNKMKKILWIIAFLLEGLCIFSQTVTLPRKEYEPENLDPEYTRDIASNFINGEPKP